MNGAEDIPITSGTTPERPCGITSILPSFSMSCRGRAEAFARRLQSRLRTLGTQSVDQIDNEDDPIIQGSNPHAWISTSLDSQVTNIQPLRQLSHEADSFFDFDCEPESPGSPAEECEYSRLIETASVTPSDFASESGYICSSPLSPENESHENSHSSSDGPYFDPECSDPDQKSLPTDYFDCDESKTDDTLNSTIILNGHHDLEINDISNDSSESVSDSLPPSQETTTPSSLTFITETSSSSSENTLKDIINELEKQCAEPISSNHNDYCNGHQDEKTIGDSLTNGELIPSDKPHLENLYLENGISAKENNEYRNLTIPSRKITEPSPEKESQPIINNIESEKSSNQKHLSIGDTDDEDDCRPQRIRRSSSLKSGKTPPGTPSRKKIVRFADVLGLDLADIKTFLDEVPTIPKSAYEDLEFIESESQAPPVQLGPRAEKMLMPLFQQPGGIPTFLDIVRDRQVSLENAIVSDSFNLTISGCVRVRNLDFHKSVHIRYTLDNWKSYADLQANYIENSCDGFSDKFSFILFGNSLIIGQRIEFAVRFHCKGQIYWDNNFGTNYCFQCLPATNTNVIRPLNYTNTSTISNQTDSWCSSFY